MNTSTNTEFIKKNYFEILNFLKWILKFRILLPELSKTKLWNFKVCLKQKIINFEKPFYEIQKFLSEILETKILILKLCKTDFYKLNIEILIFMRIIQMKIWNFKVCNKHEIVNFANSIFNSGNFYSKVPKLKFFI